MKRIAAFFLSVIVLIIGILFLLEKTKYTSMQTEILDEVSKDDTVKISIERYSDHARISIKDKEMIEKIFADLSSVELKKVRDISSDMEYAVRIYLKNENLGFEVSKDMKYIIIFKNNYKVYTDNNFLETIQNIDLQLPEK
ncbi:hypothetical protein [Paenibacillus macerans]|uniref:hypothetical protein n=1 Tax=Paenibacillus macerans TaxID=44252 RepID=UPI00203A7A64|nr:hypothetical protein [Paenibacillus macerans]MCM3699435.1 hypothetical protein [Paenibacillus macerans]